MAIMVACDRDGVGDEDASKSLLVEAPTPPATSTTMLLLLPTTTTTTDNNNNNNNKMKEFQQACELLSLRACLYALQGMDGDHVRFGGSGISGTSTSTRSTSTAMDLRLTHTALFCH
jgi:hypothetical protein